jgi:hypothetical protein
MIEQESEINQTELDRYKKAQARVEEIKGFYIHVTIYVIVNLGLVLINVLSTPEKLWFYWPLIGWGIGLVIHAVTVFGLQGFLGQEWEEKKIKQFMEKEDKVAQKKVVK